MKSNCCKAKVITNYGEESTNYYWCDKCHKACDLFMKPSKPTKPLKSKGGRRNP